MHKQPGQPCGQVMLGALLHTASAQRCCNVSTWGGSVKAAGLQLSITGGNCFPGFFALQSWPSQSAGSRYGVFQLYRDEPRTHACNVI